MAILAGEFADLPMTFNLVPSLLIQIQDYGEGRASDPWLEVAQKPADALDLNDRLFLLRSFFLARPETMIAPSPRYRELWQLRGGDPTEDELAESALHWTEGQLRDLQVWFHLAWTSPIIRERDPTLRALLEKGKGYSEEEKSLLLSLHQSLLAALVDRYRRLREAGAVELSTSPFYHPILPLLCDVSVAREADPGTALPREPFSHPEDARAQIALAVDYHRRSFGKAPEGLWPSEGSVSEPVLRIAHEEGLRWLATDEIVFRRSLERSGEPPARTLTLATWRECPDLALFFRDRDLSDRIGFRYAALPPERAVQDFVGTLRQIGRHAEPGTVAMIALDGENPWESYPEQGVPFLRRLYRALCAEHALRPITPSRYLEEGPPRRVLLHLQPGSWIDGTFRIWIGHAEDHAAWELLARARQAVVEADSRGEVPADARARAWQAVYVAQGSDWTWWYGDEHPSGLDETFDQLFRSQIQAVYQNLGLKVPDDALMPIKLKDKQTSTHQPPVSQVSPTLDGAVTHFFEWRGAGVIIPKHGAMDSGRLPIQRILYGHDPTTLWLRVDPDPTNWPAAERRLVLELVDPPMAEWEIPLTPGTHEVPGKIGQLVAAVGSIIEIGVPWALLGSDAPVHVNLAFRVREHDQVIQRVPPIGALRLDLADGTQDIGW
jgi:alpha-amylase/alpha-mannosidase (GH57 family)